MSGTDVGGMSDLDRINRTLDDVVELLEKEIERLKVSLEHYQLSEHPERRELIRWHVHALDERQDALEDLKVMLLAERDEQAVH